jgi:hypothetical protein
LPSIRRCGARARFRASPDARAAEQAPRQQRHHQQPVADAEHHAGAQREARIRRHVTLEQTGTHQQQRAGDQQFAGAQRGAAERLLAAERARSHQRLTHGRPGRARQADHGQLDAAMRDDEGKQLLRQVMLRDEGEHATQHQAVDADDVERAQAKQEAGAVGEQAHRDIVGEDLQRQDGGGHDVQQAVGPQLAALDRGDQVGRGEERDQLGVTLHQRPPGRGRQHEDQHGPGDVRQQPAHHLRQLVAEQQQCRLTEAPGAAVQRGVRARVGRLEELAGA